MARVAELLIASGATFVSEPVERTRFVFGGFEGDFHAGVTRLSCSRTNWHERGTLIANTRQISIVSVEECAEIAAYLEIDEVSPRLLGANLVTAGIDNLSGLPPGTRLQCPSGATLYVTEENGPCIQPGQKLAEALGQPRLQAAFVKAALGRRGLVALVEREGEVAAGDEIDVIFQRPRHTPKPLQALA